MASKARDLSNFISTAAIDASEIGTGAITTDKIADTTITHAKLHTTMDLSGKTVTLPTINALDVTNNINVGGTVDGVDIQTLNTTAGAALPKTGGTMTGNLVLSAANSQVGIGTDNMQIFNSVGGSSGLVVTGVSSSTAILGNTLSNITIANGDGTANNTAALHFAREDTDGNPNYAGASVVSQFKETQVTGQYPKADLAFLTSTAANSAPSEKMRIDSSGNVGIGVTSEAWNANYTALRLGTRTALFNTTAGNAETTVLSNNYVNSSSEQHIQTGPASFYQQYNGTHAFQVIPSAAAGAAVSITNAMTIKNNTNISIPSNTHAVVGVEEALNINCFRDGSGNDFGLFLNGNNSAGTHTSIRFHNNIHGLCGSITNGINSTAYNTSSDYRLKTDVQPMTGATARLMQLKPCNFEWISSGERVDGFLAHELGGVIPAAATGTKDAMRDEEYEVTAATDTEAAVTGTRSVPDMQGIDQSKLVPLLTATIQELIARIEALEA